MKINPEKPTWEGHVGDLYVWAWHRWEYTGNAGGWNIDICHLRAFDDDGNEVAVPDTLSDETAETIYDEGLEAV